MAAWSSTALGQAASVDLGPQLERLGVEDGLSHNSVSSVVQDQRGFLWFGTADGLNRYDGYTFLVHRAAAGDTESLPSNAVQALLVDRVDNVWVGTRRGLARLGPDRRRYERLSLRDAAQAAALGAGPDREPSIHALIAADRGEIWVATAAGLYRIDRAVGGATLGGTHVTRVLADPVDGLGIDPTGALWAVGYSTSESSVLFRVDDEVERFTIPLHGKALRFTTNGDLWLDARGPLALPELLVEQAAWVDRRPPVAAPDPEASAIVVDQDGRTWIGTYQGIYREDANGIVRRVRTDDSTDLDDETTAILLARDGAVWIATYGGILHYDPHRKPFRHFGLEAGLPAVAVSSITERPDGEIWIGTYGGGAARFDTGSDRFVAAPGTADPGTADPGNAAAGAGRCDDYIWDLEADAQGDLWLATRDGLCVQYPDGTRRQLALPPDAGQPTNLNRARDGALWVGASGGLLALDVSSRTFRQIPLPAPESPYRLDALRVAADDAVWVASGHGHLARYDSANDTLTGYPDSVAEGIWDIYPDGPATAWLATGSGLVRLLAGPPHFVAVAPAGDSIGGVAFSVLTDHQGRLWVGTNNGLIRFDPSGGPTGTSRRFGIADGVENREFNRHAALRDSRGRLWFGGMSGVTMFDPSAIVDSPVAPTVAITDVRVLDDTGERSFPTGDELTLAPATHAVTLEFAALDFTDSARSRYRYQLEGVDPGWIENGPRRSVRYTNLPPGRFVFRVHGTSRDGVWSVAEATQVLVVRPAFWQTLWFRLTVVVGVLAGLAAGYRWRIHRVHELERMRLRIASDLHDEVSSELAAITLLSGMLGKREYLAPDDRDSLDEIGLTSRRINDALRDIVWYVNPEHDTVGSMVARMRRTAGRLLVDIEHTFDADVEDAAARIGMHRRREIVLAYKELVHNAVRHADAGRVEITIRARDARFHMTIRDDGIGFDVDGSSGGTGLPSVRRRAARIGGEIGIASEATIGTVVELTAPLVAP